ncbi:YkvA family protein [Desulfopila aestuarii]|uniref:DUF1232 domain-containing protein n=1 Tax=Desulfopila aestuarii DSM 18488 TaxID=1121416 RepID=A0A1M7YBR7_9BACT|nr:DUF1232 domain-containing protein [Desulfopila aestuarii]SHO50082.1 Protein of unknown function [Desulfopila aestuarii DSM 18488]
MESETFGRFYSPVKFIEKVKNTSKAAGLELIRQAVTLFVILQGDNVPTWAKAIIIGSLGYFICPIDLIPDFLPMGLTDDLVELTAAMQQVVVFCNPSVKRQVDGILSHWFE